jgi:hypothetical protein
VNPNLSTRLSIFLGIFILCVAVLFPCSVSSRAQQCPETCLKALQSAAYDEQHINQNQYSHQKFQQSFCDAIHQVQQGKSSAEGDGLTGISCQVFHTENKRDCPKRFNVVIGRSRVQLSLSAPDISSLQRAAQSGFSGLREPL